MSGIFKTIFRSKQTIFILLLFLCFFPIKTQVYNALTFIFDQLFTGGKISELFTYNYTGDLFGCEEVAKFHTYESTMNFFQKHGELILKFLISIGFWWLLYRDKQQQKTFQNKHWCYLFVFSFYLFNALETAYYVFFVYDFSLIRTITKHVLLIAFAIPTIILAAHTFFGILKKKEKLQLIFIVFPASLLSAYLWFAYLGPKLLPI